MIQELPLDDALASAGRLAGRSVTMLRLWSATASEKAHLRHRKAISEHYEHLRFIQQSLLFSAIVGAHGLLAGSRSSLTIPRLISRARGIGIDTAEPEAVIAHVATITLKMGILRHEAFAHLSPAGTYDDAFTKANVTPNELHAACEAALAATNHLLAQRGLRLHSATDTAVTSYQQMLTLLLHL